MSFGPLTMIALVLVLLDLGAFFVLVSRGCCCSWCWLHKCAPAELTCVQLGGAAAIQKKAVPITTLVNSTPVCALLLSFQSLLMSRPVRQPIFSASLALRPVFLQGLNYFDIMPQSDPKNIIS